MRVSSVVLMGAAALVAFVVGLRLAGVSPQELFPRLGTFVSPPSPPAPRTVSRIWVSDFKGNRVFAVTPAGEVVWEQHMASSPIPSRSANVHVEYVTLAPDGNPITADGEGMMAQELDRTTHALLWQYGVRSIQGYERGYLHQPDKAYKLNDHDVLINDGNNRRVIIVDQRTGDIVWQYGKTLVMGRGPGLLRGNTHAVPVDGGQRILITDTLEKKLLLVDRASGGIVWEWAKPDAGWLQHASPTRDGTFILEDRQKGEVFELARDGRVLWTLTTLADGRRLHTPTDAVKLERGNVLIAEAGRGRIIEVVPSTGEVVWQYGGSKPIPRASAGYATTIAVEYD